MTKIRDDLVVILEDENSQGLISSNLVGTLTSAVEFVAGIFLEKVKHRVYKRLPRSDSLWSRGESSLSSLYKQLKSLEMGQIDGG